MEGSVLGGRYEILERLGGGGMATVYLALDQALERRVAVKVMNDSLSHDQGFIKRFHREAKAAGSLSHPNVVNVYDVDSEEDIYYIVMELVKGKSLMELIEERGSLPASEAAQIAIQVLEGLEHAHENGIVHRDIKPHNIMVNDKGRFKVTDFGISRVSKASTITQTGSVIGTVHYFSPEQAKGKETNSTSDLYSVGIVLYEMVTGTIPFDGEEAIGIALQHLQDPVPDPRAIQPDIPESFCQIIYRAMEKDPKDRFQTAQEMIVSLQHFLYNHTSGSYPFPLMGENSAAAAEGKNYQTPAPYWWNPNGQQTPPPYWNPNGQQTPPPQANENGQQAPPPQTSGHGQQTPPPQASGYGQQAPPPQTSGHNQQTPPPQASGYGQQTPPPQASKHGQQTPPPHASGHGQQTPPPRTASTPKKEKDKTGCFLVGGAILSVLIGLTAIILFIGYFIFNDFIQGFNEGFRGGYQDEPNQSDAEQADDDQSDETEADEVDENGDSADTDTDSDADGYNWKQDIPENEGNDTFQNFSHEGENGNYTVTLDVKMDDFAYNYDVIVSDQNGERTVREKQTGISYGEGTSNWIFVRQDELPGPGGLIKVAYYKQDGSERTEYLLEEF
ncbi:protein kinase domain-containing protein [Desmospora activa]|uniref:Serine/threonine-protein kinase PrkC n=1 Tax=Desmospora activa DSM 45169 TaxID=1121389 RepID=A0A2T4Z6R3_9BACL|nr:protein kinase [Desmospora activa]PTM57579.1 serine/threonine protein kinase [Desmospora activa DSM 45169]